MTAVGDGPELGRIAELIVDGHGGEEWRSSGYLVSDSVVLTAAHVVVNATAVRVRFNAGRQDEWIADAINVWYASDPLVDVAAVTIRPHDGQRLAVVRFGRVGDHLETLTCIAVGFPRFKVRDDPLRPANGVIGLFPYRVCCQANGTVAPLSNRREGSFEFLVPAPELDPDPAVSPWEGMSGAALWCGGRVIGVVSKHHRAEGLNRLTATRVDCWYERLDAGKLAEICSHFRLPRELGRLMDVGFGGSASAQQPALATDLALGPDVREYYGPLLTQAGAALPTQWDLAELTTARDALECQRPTVADPDVDVLMALDVLTALCEALRAKPVLSTLGGKEITLGRLVRIYRREIGGWPRGESSDALLVEAALVTIAERRQYSGKALTGLVRFVLGIASHRNMSLDNNDLVAWFQSAGHQLADARTYLQNRSRKPVWLLIDLGDETRSSDPGWPSTVSATLHAFDGDTCRFEEECHPSEGGLSEALRALLNSVPSEQEIVVDLAAPRNLLDRRIENWPLVEVDDELEPLSASCRPRLRWSKRRRDQKLRTRLIQRVGDADWTAKPAIVPGTVVGDRHALEQWLRVWREQPYVVAGTQGRAAADPLRVLLREGCGFVVWFSAGIDDDTARHTTTLAEKVPAAARRYVLPDIFGSDIFGSNNYGDLGTRRPVIIWDDPDGREDFSFPQVALQSPEA